MMKLISEAEPERVNRGCQGLLAARSTTGRQRPSRRRYGAWLHHLRTEKGLTQQQLADETHTAAEVAVAAEKCTPKSRAASIVNVIEIGSH